jgi:hypothetical protein
MTHKLLAVAGVAVLALLVSACAQDDAAATAAEEIETGPVMGSKAETGSTVVENLLNLPPQFVPSTADEHRPIHL